MRKCIHPDRITGVVADVADSEYPAINIMDFIPSNPYRSTGRTGTLTLSVAGGANHLGLCGLNASTVTVTVKDSDQNIVFQQTFSLSGIDNLYKFFTGRATMQDTLGLEYPYQSSAHTIIINLDSGNDSIAVECGVAQAGPPFIFRAPMRMKLGFKDYSIKDKYDSGGKYYLKRNIVFSFSASLRLDVQYELFVFAKDLVKEIGELSKFWWVTDTENKNYFIFAGFDGLPGGNVDNRYSFMNITLLEEV